MPISGPVRCTQLGALAGNLLKLWDELTGDRGKRVILNRNVGRISELEAVALLQVCFALLTLILKLRSCWRQRSSEVRCRFRCSWAGLPQGAAAEPRDSDGSLAQRPAEAVTLQPCGRLGPGSGFDPSDLGIVDLVAKLALFAEGSLGSGAIRNFRTSCLVQDFRTACEKVLPALRPKEAVALWMLQAPRALSALASAPQVPTLFTYLLARHGQRGHPSLECRRLPQHPVWEQRGSLRKEDLKALLIGVVHEEREETWGEGGGAGPLQLPPARSTCCAFCAGFHEDMQKAFSSNEAPVPSRRSLQICAAVYVDTRTKLVSLTASTASKQCFLLDSRSPINLHTVGVVERCDGALLQGEVRQLLCGVGLRA